MTRSRLGWLLWVIMILIPLIIIGLSILLYLAERRHRQVLNTEIQALDTLLRVDRATVLLDSQRISVAQSIYLPLNRAVFQAHTTEFLGLFQPPTLFPHSASRQIRQEILTEYRQFVHTAVALPPAPTVVQVQAVQTQAEDVVLRLNALRELHTTNVNAAFYSERTQNRVSDIVLLVTNITVLLLVILGLILFARLAKEQLEAATLRTTDHLRNEFVAFAAHELRNPASAIKTGASLLREPELEPDIRAQIVESINRSADALSRLVLNLLAMGRLEEGKLHLNCQTVLLSGLMDELVAELEVYHPGVEQRIARTLPAVYIGADPEYLKLAFSNIFDNALKFAPPRTVVTVTGEQVGLIALIHIHNEGPAIPPEVLPHIFEKYETTGGAPYTTRRGIGLGLYMTRLLIDVHEGRVWVESIPEKGTTITVSLPVVEAPEQPA